MSVKIQQVYVGDSIQKEARRMVRAAKRGKVPKDCWLITFSDIPGSELEIVRSFFLRGELVIRPMPKIVGIAGTKGEAYDLLTEMAEDCFRARGDACLKAFLES